MQRAFCPKCGALRNMEVTTSRRKVTRPDGTKREIVARTYHCETCRAFVRSESAPAT